MSVLDEDYSRNVSCALILIFTFLFLLYYASRENPPKKQIFFSKSVPKQFTNCILLVLQLFTYTCNTTNNTTHELKLYIKTTNN
jgi:Ni,Fe-hydrogenase I cytochrome b subunit